MDELVFIGSSRNDLREFPDEVQDEMGHALYLVQLGSKPGSAKPLKGHHGASVLEIVEDFDSDTFRAVYTVRLAGRVYVLHCFQKKSAQGIKTRQRDIELIRSRLRTAEEIHKTWLEKNNQK